MVIQTTVNRVKEEYREYLRGQHPEWEEDTLGEYVEDAFFMYRNRSECIFPFWQCFESDESMAAAREEILEFLAQTMEADQAKERTDDYLGEMERLKAFLDEKGGVKAYIGPEYDCEETVYQYAKMAYEGAITEDQAVEALGRETTYKKSTIEKAVTMFKNMMDGNPVTYKTRFNKEATALFITRIGEDYGRESMIHAMKAAWEGFKITYREERKTLKVYRSACAKLAKTYQIDLDFGDSMFEGIVPDEPVDDILADVARQAEADKESDNDLYTKENFLRDVFMDEERYLELKHLLLRKQNVILQGAPGVGKTFAAKLLVYSIMGEKDDSRVQTVQFHQSYSYEDFIMGYRPIKTGFKLKTGIFYDFCRQAAKDAGRDYFFIIDEINRGNLSKIFGELFMLIENDKRGEKLGLLYANEQFSIPENVYLLGMMNTADRSLAMMDYALRRRFAFFTMEPAFDSAGFRRYQKKKGSAKFDRLIDTVKALNEKIADDESLGEGFCIGHSYFYTQDRITDEWLTAVVKTELIPLLKEYWFDEKEKVESWSERLLEAVQ